MNIDKNKLKEVIDRNLCIYNVLEELNLPQNTYHSKKIQKLCKEYDIDISFYLAKKSWINLKHPKIEKICPICNCKFITKANWKKEKTVCSVACSNKFFRTGENNPNFIPLELKTAKQLRNNSNYRKFFDLDNLSCSRCGYNEFKSSVQIHHIDEDRSNNKKENLMPLCANCHMALHNNLWKLVM